MDAEYSFIANNALKFSSPPNNDVYARAQKSIGKKVMMEFVTNKNHLLAQCKWSLLQNRQDYILIDLDVKRHDKWAHLSSLGQGFIWGHFGIPYDDNRNNHLQTVCMWNRLLLISTWKLHIKLILNETHTHKENELPVVSYNTS